MKKEKGNDLFHKLDKYIGIPVVYLLGIFRKKNIKPETIQNIAVLNLGSIGDNVLMSASISDLRKNYPDAILKLFTGSTNYQIVKLIPGVNEVIKLSLANIFSSIKLIKNSGSYDVLIDFGPWPRINAIYSNFFNSKFKIGFNASHQYRHYIYDATCNHSANVHEIDNYRSLLSLFSSGQLSKPILQTDVSIKVDELISKYKRICVIHPWPGGYKSFMKEWDIENWVSLISLINKDFDMIFISGAKGDYVKSKIIYERLLGKKISNVVNLAGELNIAELVYFISKVNMIFSVNTGIAHIAAAFDVPQICLHGPTNIKRWGPVSDKTISVAPKVGTYGYLNFGNEYYLAKENCMENISVEMVISVYKKLS